DAFKYLDFHGHRLRTTSRIRSAAKFESRFDVALVFF
ncbi:MAG: hypothetical protein K0R41_3583, partial [Geminicoccaceae bacterium]|nr:hypothetical protein [Geminicoccaceae bacterium]